MSNSGTMWHLSQSPNPAIGNCYADATDNVSYIWLGSEWLMFSDTVVTETFTLPTEEQLNKHPALKQAWEEFLVVKRLLGV